MKRTSVDLVLDATYEVVRSVGVQRTTFSEIARTAGVSRATLYTHFPDVNAAVAALLTREMGQLLLHARGGAVDQPTARAQLLAAVSEVLREVPRNPLWSKIMELDAEVLLPYLVQRLGSVQRSSMAVVHELVRAGQHDGSIRAGDPAVLAHLVVTTVQSFLVGHRIGNDELGAGAVHDAVLDLLDHGLAP